MRLLISGTSSGLGRYLLKRLGGVAFQRSAPMPEQKSPFDAIVHCAFNSTRDVPLDAIPAYLDDNIGLTERLLSVPHRCFVYLSTVDLYPEGEGPYDEACPIDAKDIRGVYALTKAASEALVRAHGPDHLILRPTSLIGPDARPSAPIRLLRGYDGPMGLAPGSRYNLIRHQDVADFILACLERNMRGTFNLASSNTIPLKDMALALGRSIEFGTHPYKVANVSNAKAREILPAFGRTSEEVLSLLRADSAFQDKA
ncbi:MAG: NAD(P)-dependent oxidoreductase [Rhodospirillales bacterium]|nr:MAG: NAD(P)-dependent oxidoreductase [Rhodospirillales bacterium]